MIEDNVHPIVKSSTDNEEHNSEESEAVYMIIEAVLRWSVQEAGLQEAFAQNIGSNLQ